MEQENLTTDHGICPHGYTRSLCKQCEQPSKETSLSDLKRSIEAMDTEDRKLACDPIEWQALRAEAWRTAFEWRTRWDHLSYFDRDEGMRLIREKLK